MAYLLAGTTIRAPHEIEESNSTQFAQQRTLAGSVGRDYFGSNKRSWTLTYENVKATDFATIDAIYDAYLSTGTAQTWQVTESNYTVSQTNVHIDLQVRNFTMSGTGYISNFTLVLTEA